MLSVLVFITLNLTGVYSAIREDQFKDLARLSESKQKVLGGNVCLLALKDNNIEFMKNLRVKDRQKNYLEIREAVNSAMK